MRPTGDDRHGFTLRALIVVLWRGGLRIQEAIALGERDLDHRRRSLLVRSEGGRRREIGMDTWGWEQLRPWLAARVELPIGPLFCVIERVDPRAAVVERERARRVPPLAPKRVSGGASRRTSYVTPTPSSSRARAWRSTSSSASSARQPRHDQRLPAWHRYRRDHRHGTRPARADDVRHRGAASLSDPKTATAGAAPALPLPARAGHRFDDQCDRHMDSPTPPLRARTSSIPVVCVLAIARSLSSRRGVPHPLHAPLRRDGGSEYRSGIEPLRSRPVRCGTRSA
jgi:hypothetical protein